MIKYEDTKAVVISTVSRFYRCYGGDYDDLCEAANFHLGEAWLSYDKRKSSFPTWARRIIWNRLLSGTRKEARRNKKLPRRHISWDAQTGREDGTSRFLWLYADLSADAKKVVDLALEWPRVNRRTALSQIKRKLKKNGWDQVRIVGSINEIRRAIR